MPGVGEVVLIVLLVLIVFFGEKVGAIGDAIGRARTRGAPRTSAPKSEELPPRV